MSRGKKKEADTEPTEPTDNSSKTKIKSITKKSTKNSIKAKELEGEIGQSPEAENNIEPTIKSPKKRKLKETDIELPPLRRHFKKNDNEGDEENDNPIKMPPSKITIENCAIAKNNKSGKSNNPRRRGKKTDISSNEENNGNVEKEVKGSGGKSGRRTGYGKKSGKEL